jgi:hypothetical protein
MSTFLNALATVLIALCISPARASQCTQDIHETMLAVSSKLTEIAVEGGTSHETQYATMHRQPTPSTIAQAEVLLGELPMTAAQVYDVSMRRDTDADSVNNLAGCRRALLEAQRALTQMR